MAQPVKHLKTVNENERQQNAQTKQEQAKQAERKANKDSELVYI